MSEEKFLKLVEDCRGFEFYQAYRGDVDHVLGGKDDTCGKKPLAAPYEMEQQRPPRQKRQNLPFIATCKTTGHDLTL